MLERTPKYTLRKLSVGLASVMIGSGILINSPKVLADTTNAGEGTSTVVQTSQPSGAAGQPSGAAGQPSGAAGQPSSQTEDKSKINVQSDTSQDKNTGSKSSENKLVKPSAGTPDSNVPAPKPTTGDVEAKQKSEQTKTPDPFTPAKPTDNPDADPETTPLVNQKVNDQPVKAQKGASFEAYITAKDKSTGQEYVTSYLGNDKAMSTINLDLVDPNSLEYHVIYHNGGETFNPNFYIGTYNGFLGQESNMYVDESRINDQNKLIQTKSSGSHNVIFRVGNTGKYVNYDEYLKKYKDTSGQGLSAWKISDFTLNANDTASVTIPIKFRSTKSEGIGVVDRALYWTTGDEKFQSQVSLVNQTVFENEKKYIPAEPTPTAEINGKKPAIYNEGISDAPAISDNGNVAYVYFTGKDFNGNEFVSNYLSPTSKNVDINFDESDPNALDPNTLELHMIYQNNSNKKIWNNFRLTSPTAVKGASSSLTIDTSRLNDENSKYFEKSGLSYQLRYKVSNSGETYITYDQWKAGKDTTYKDKNLILAWSGWGVSRLGPGDIVTAVVPVRIEHGQNQKLGLIDWQGHFSNLTGNVNVIFSKKKELDFAKPTAGGTFTEDNTIPVYYNYSQDGLAHTEPETEWYRTKDGTVAYYLTFKDKNNKNYVTTYTKTGLRILFDSDMIDRQSISFVGYYENNDKEANPELRLAVGNDFAIDKDKVTAIDTDGNQLNLSFSQNDSNSKVTQVAVDGQVAANKALKFTVPLIYTGDGYTYESHFSYGYDGQNKDLTVILSAKDYDLNKREVVLLPATNLGDYKGMYVPELDQALKKAGVNEKDTFFVSNFHVPAYDLFNINTVPKGDNPTIVYKSSEEFYLLDKIEDVITKHGYTVEFRTNNGKRVPMIFSSFYGPHGVKIYDPQEKANTTNSIVLMANTDPGSGKGNSINIYYPKNVIMKYFNTVPAILINSDKVYDQTSSPTLWDPRNIGKDTGTTDAEKAKDQYLLRGYYRADFDSGVELPSFSELEKNYSLDSHATAEDPNYLHVDITWQASPDSQDVEKLDSDKIDLSRAGYYTITYWHEYGDSKTKVSNVGHVTVLPTRKATVVVHDTTDNQDLKSYETEGHVGDNISFDDLSAYLSDLEKQNYQIDDNPLTGDNKFTWDESQVAYVIKVSHKQETSSKNKLVTRTINYQTADGQIIDSHKDTLTFTQTGTKDLVTGETTWNESIPSQMFEAVNVPTRPGYRANRAMIPAKQITVDASNWNANLDYVETVIYTKDSTEPENPTSPVKEPDNPSDNNNNNSNNDNNGGNNSGAIVPINPSDNNSNNSNTAPTDNKKTDDTKKDNTGKKITKETPKKVKNNKSNKTKSTTTSKSNQSSKTKRTTQTKKPTRTNRTDDISPKANVMNMTKRTTKSGTISPKAVALANTTAGPATSAKANMENGIAKNNSQNSQTLPQTGENESKVAFAVAGLLAAALGIFGIAINRKKEN